MSSQKYQSLIVDLCIFLFQHFLYVVQGLEWKLSNIQLPNDLFLAFVHNNKPCLSVNHFLQEETGRLQDK